MPLQVKLIFTCATVTIAIAVLFIDPKGDNAGPAWLWRGGKGDPVRNTICRTDGSLRKYTRLGILTWFVVFLTALWLVA